MSDERSELLRLLPDPARHDLPEDRQRILRQRFLYQIEGAPAPPAPWRRRRVLGLATAGAVAVALGAAGVLGSGAGPSRPGDTPAAGLLDRIALVAAHGDAVPPAGRIRDDQFAYVETFGGHADLVYLQDGTGTRAVWYSPYGREIWTSVDGRRPGLLRDRNVSPTDVDLGTVPAPSLNNPTLRYLESLPVDPDALLRKIYAETRGHGQNPRQEAFATIGDLIRESVLPGGLAAALYQAAARIPGITAGGDAVDALGRHGVTVARTDAGVRTEWIFDPGTLQYLGERSVTTRATKAGPAGTLVSSTAVLHRAIVDRPGQIPTA